MRQALTVISVLLLGTAAAQAHIVAKPDTGTAGSYFGTQLIVSHGCEGSDTVSVTVQIPKDILIVKPQMKPGWTIDIRKQTLDKPVPGPHGSTITEITTEITWKGRLPDAYFDTLGLSMKLPDKTGMVYLPTHQICEKGERNWNQLPKEGQSAHELESPAPSLKVLPGDAHPHQH